MELEFRRDFDEVKKRWRMFWEGRLQRQLMIVVVPKKEKKTFSPPDFGVAYYTEHEDIAGRILRWAESHDFHCDAVPFALKTVSIVLGLVQVLLGAGLKELRWPSGDKYSDPALSR